MDGMDKRIELWVRLCESLCAPEQVIRYDDPDRSSPSVGSIGVLSSLKTDRMNRTTLAEMTRRTADLAGVLRGRTMYVVPYAGFRTSRETAAGLVVTDSPHVVDTLHRRFATGRAALGALRAIHEMTAELYLAFPPRHIAVPIPRDAPELPSPCSRCTAPCSFS